MTDFTVPNQVTSTMTFGRKIMPADKNPLHVLCYGMKVI